MWWATLWGILAIVTVVVVGTLIAAAVLRRRRRGQLVSFVLMRLSRRGLSIADVRGAARRGLGGNVDAQELPPVNEQVQGFLVLLNGAPGFFVLDAGRPYSDDPAAESTRFEDPRAREAFASHTAWIAVDLAGAFPKELHEPMLRLMARLAAEFYDDQTTLLFAPAISRVALPGPEIEAALRSDNPLSIFGDDDVNTPIIAVQKGDKRLEKAMAEARHEWPTFLEVYRRRGAACHPMVKGAFAQTDGGHEYMWVEVSAVDDLHITGSLANEPAHVKGLRKGDTVTFSSAEVSDWVCLDDGDEPKGLFAERLIRGG